MLYYKKTYSKLNLYINNIYIYIYKFAVVYEI